ncbi:MAG: hypothetical protein ACLFQP_03040 [Halothece sp.]
MSEYQYYEFQTVERPLTKIEKEQIKQLSSRVQLSSTQAIFTYSYGDFRGNPEEVLLQYFDAMFYIANWGTMELRFRLPASLIDITQIQPYCLDDCLSVSQHNNSVILEICLNNEEGFGWIEDHYLDSLIELRQALLQGDYRLLYLAWLKGISLLQLDENQLEPPIPSGLQQLSPSLQAFIELFEVDEDLVKIAANASPKLNFEAEESLEDAIPLLSRHECDSFLLRLLRGEPNVTIALKQKLSEFTPSHSPSAITKRTVGELLSAAESERKETERRQKQEAEAKRIQALEALAKRKDSVWESVERLIEKGQAKSYDEAVAMLGQLRELAELENQLKSFQDKIDTLRERYSRRSALIQRFNKAGLK